MNNAIGYLGSKPGYEREWPDRDPASAEAWEKARLLLLVVEEEKQNDRSQRGEGQIRLTKDQRQRFDELVDALRAVYLHHRCRSRLVGGAEAHSGCMVEVACDARAQQDADGESGQLAFGANRACHSSKVI